MVQLVLDPVFQEILQVGRPPGQLVLVFSLTLVGLVVRLALDLVGDDVDAQVHHIGDDALLLGGNLSVLNQFVDVLLRNPIFHNNVQQDDAKLVVDGDLAAEE